MQSINFDDGFKSFCLNNDESKIIRFNPADFGILQRIEEAYNMIDDASEKSQDVEINSDGTAKNQLSEAVSIVKGYDDAVRMAIDHIFNSPVSEIVFGKQSPISTVKGDPFFIRFMEAAIPFIKKEVVAEKKASQSRINKYTSQVKDK